jgi:predicted amidophosphoribosyltransferase
MIKIIGNWTQGFAYDRHIIKSICIGKNQYGHPLFETHYTQMGKFIYQLKSKQDINSVLNIVELLIKDIQFQKFINDIDIILPAPHSNKVRPIQPVIEVVKEISRLFKKEMRLDIVSSKNTQQVKNLDDKEKFSIVKESIVIKDDKIDKSKNILIFDDIFDSGATLQAITEGLIEKGFTSIKIFTLTKTKQEGLS